MTAPSSAYTTTSRVNHCPRLFLTWSIASHDTTTPKTLRVSAVGSLCYTIHSVRFPVSLPCMITDLWIPIQHSEFQVSPKGDDALRNRAVDKPIIGINCWYTSDIKVLERGRRSGSLLQVLLQQGKPIGAVPGGIWEPIYVLPAPIE